MGVQYNCNGCGVLVEPARRGYVVLRFADGCEIPDVVCCPACAAAIGVDEAVTRLSQALTLRRVATLAKGFPYPPRS